MIFAKINKEGTIPNIILFAFLLLNKYTNVYKKVLSKSNAVVNLVKLVGVELTDRVGINYLFSLSFTELFFIASKPFSYVKVHGLFQKAVYQN